MTKAEAWDIVSGIVENIDTEDMTQLIEHLDSQLRKQIDTEKKLNKAAAERQVIATWYKPEEKLPPDDGDVVVTFSGNYGQCSYRHALGLAWYQKDEGWAIDDMGEEESDAMTIEAWCDLDAYGISPTIDTKLN